MENKKTDNSKILFSIGKALYDNKKYLEGFEYIKLAAKEGDIDAMVLCGEILYKNDAGITTDFKKAAQYFKMAADLGNIKGMTKFGDMLRFGFGVKIDKIEAVIWYRKAENETNKKREYLEKQGEIVKRPYPFKSAPNKYEESNMIYEPIDYDIDVYDFVKSNTESPKIGGTIDESICNFFDFTLKNSNNINLISKLIVSQNYLIQNFIKIIYYNNKEYIIDSLLENLHINDVYNIFLSACNDDKIDLIKRTFSYILEKDDEFSLMGLNTGLNITNNKNFVASSKKLIQLGILHFFNKLLNNEDKEKLSNDIMEINEISNIRASSGEPILCTILTNEIFIEDLNRNNPTFIEQIIKNGINFGENEFYYSKSKMRNIAETVKNLLQKLKLNTDNELLKQFISLSQKVGFLYFGDSIKINKNELDGLNIKLKNFSNTLKLLENNKKNSENILLLKNFEDNLEEESESKELVIQFK